MCGIAGIVGCPADEALLGRFAAQMQHRGPDGGGFLHDEAAQVALVARRLAIVDIAGGEQPMTTPDGRCTLVFNGEIYNAPELRAELERDGHAFSTDHSDTEVVLALYARDGSRMLERLNGMFAVAIYDRDAQRVFLARDRFGIKPLYYLPWRGGVAFASELRTLLALPDVERAVDMTSLFHYLSLRFVPGSDSILAGVKRLPPAHFLEIDLRTKDVVTQRWWSLSFSAQDGVSREECVHRLREELRAAVQRWTLSDVPVACSLSGGLDSSAIVGLLAEGGHGDLRTYSLGFSDPADESLDELHLARSLAQRWGTDHHELVVEPEELLDDLLQLVWALDEPYGGGLPSWYVFRFMGADVKVGLTGTGGDELFGNYRRFVPFETGRLARLRGGNVRRYHFEPAYYLTDDEKRGLLHVRSRPDTASLLQQVYDESPSRNPRDAVLYLDTATQLPDEFLLMTDRFSMAHSLEARTPFLDNELVDFVAAIPPDLRTSRRDPKGLLRDAVADLLTPEHLTAPKRGFVFPFARWLRGDLRPLAERLLDEGRLEAQGIFRPGLAARYLAPHLEGRSDESERLWPLLMFQLWHLLYVEEALTEPPTFTWRDVVR